MFSELVRMGDYALFAEPYGSYLVQSGPHVRKIVGDDARRIEHELLIGPDGAACSRRMFELICESYLAPVAA